MNFQELASKAGLTRQHHQAIQSHDLQATIEGYLASRSFSSGSLSSACLTALIDSGQLAGHAMGQDTLKRFDATLAQGIALLEEHLPKINHALEVESRDPFAGSDFA